MKSLNACPHCLSHDIRTLTGVEGEGFVSFRCQACERTFHYATIEARSASAPASTRHTPDRRQAAPAVRAASREPMPNSSVPAAVPASARTASAGAGDEEGSVIVLNVEDVEPTRFLRSKVLRGAGFGIVEAGTASLVKRGADALEGSRDEPSLNWVVTDSVGLVLEASAEAAQTLGIGRAHLRGRSLLTFFDGERAEWSRALIHAHAGTTLERSGRLRPRDRRPVVVEATISQAVDYPRAGAVLWSFRTQERGRR